MICVLEVGDLYVGTIHGYCYRLLTDYFNYGNHDVFDENQERAFLSIVGKDLGLADSGNYIRNLQKLSRDREGGGGGAHPR